MTAVGFTTGSLYKSAIPFDERIELYQSLGADAIELSFATPNQLFAYQLSEQSEKNIRKFSSVSIHSSWKEVRYDDNTQTRRIIEKVRLLCSKLPVRGIVLHPDTIDNFEILEESELPFLLENMDQRKTYGTHPDQFSELKNKYKFGFVLDVEHAYEHDSSMQLAKELIEVMGNRLKQMHISGNSNSEMHVPTYCAVNKEAITNILKMRLDVPRVLEGIISGNIQNSITNELNYIRNLNLRQECKKNGV